MALSDYDLVSDHQGRLGADERGSCCPGAYSRCCGECLGAYLRAAGPSTVPPDGGNYLDQVSITLL